MRRAGTARQLCSAALDGLVGRGGEVSTSRQRFLVAGDHGVPWATAKSPRYVGGPFPQEPGGP